MQLVNLPPARANTDVMLLLQQCTGFLQKFDRIVSHTATGDVQAVKVAGFPYLRTSRFLASFRDRVMDKSGWQQWLEMMRQLDLDARLIEWRHLETEWRSFISVAKPVSMASHTTMEAVDQCGSYFVTKDLADPGRLKQLRDVMQVADDYQDWKRVLGLYGLTRHAAMNGIEKLAELTLQRYRTELGDLVPLHTSQILVPQNTSILHADQLRAMMQDISRNPLKIPLPSNEQAALLLQHYAPVWVVAQATENDRIGKPGWRNGQSWPDVDYRQPVVYTLLGHTRFHGKNLLQLVYTVWFPGRTAESAIDTLAGHIDGITWRVTLDSRGRPLIYDSMHNCGCYHLFFPVGNLVPRQGMTSIAMSIEEAALVPQQLTDMQAGQRMHLYVTAGSHDLVRVRAQQPDKQSPTYNMHDYDELRMLPTEGELHRSLFNSVGLVPGTERLESLYLWPMGILRPGAMRQWGHHATAFVGRRHFDQVDLMERYFENRE